MILALLAVLIRYKIILFGLPHSLHPDETYIYKDPLKILLLYKNGDFSQPYNLVNWLFTCWTGLLYFGGKLIGQWSSFAEFQDMLVLEHGSIILGYRLMSLLASVVSLLVLHDLCCKITENNTLRILFILTFILNPVEILSDSWIKYDPYVFLMLSVLLNYSYSYFFLDRKHLSRELFILSLTSIAVRIEFIAFFAAILTFDIYLSLFGPIKSSTATHLRRTLASVLTGIFVYCLLTLTPVTFLYNHLFSSVDKIGVTRSFEAVIFSRLWDYYKNGTLFNNLAGNFVFYFKTGLYSLGPITLLAALLLFLKLKKGNYLMIFVSFTGVVLLLYGYHATHYFLGISVVLLLAACIYIARMNDQRLRLAFAALNFLYISSLSLGFLYNLTREEDPRIASAGYIIHNTKPTDLLAVETLSMNGYAPVIGECREVLLQKSETVAKYGGGTGETYRLKAQLADSNCRKMIDIFSKDYFSKSPFEGTWINPYNAESLAKRAPAYYITTAPFEPKTKFYDHVTNNYNLVKEFSCGASDPRLAFLLKSEFYFKPVRIYKKNELTL